MNVAACDLGGTRCRTAVVAYEGNTPHLLEETYGSWRSKNERDLGQVLDRGIGETIRKFNGQIHGTALAVAGPIPDHRTLFSSPNIACLHNITPLNLAGELERRFDRESWCANDVEAPCAGEVEMGSLRGVKNALLENIGSGWGGANVENGVTFAAEPGHAYIPQGGVLCGCGKTDCAEAGASGIAVERRLHEMDSRGEIQIPEEFRANPGAFADQEAEKGTPWAVQLYTSLATFIGNVWGTRLNYRPSITHIAYQGSMLECAMRIGFFRDEVRRTMLARSMLPQIHENVQIVELAAPKLQSGEPLGPLYGAASIWKRLHDEQRAA